MIQTNAPKKERILHHSRRGTDNSGKLYGQKSEPIISTKNLSVEFSNIHAISSLDFEVFPGEVLGLLGDNGAGKTTLVETIMGLQSRYSGDIFYLGKKIEHPSVIELRKAGIEIAYQKSALNACQRVWENFFIGREITKGCGPIRFLDKKMMRRETNDFLRKQGVEIPFSVVTPVGKLSGGQRRILSILRAYYFTENLLILDEPTAALSEHEVEIVLNLVKKAKSKGIAVIFITHKEHEVFEIADRFFILNQGNKYMVIKRKFTLLSRVNSLLISSRVLAVKDIAAEIVHQFSEPLKDMRSKAKQLKYDYKVINDSELFQELIDTLRSEIQSLSSIIYHLSNLSEEPQLSRSNTSIGKVIDSVIFEIPHTLRAEVDFDIRVENELRCNIDRDILKQVLLNLIINAIEASERKGIITISANWREANTGDLVIKVKDRGRGMDTRTQQEIFNPFFTTKASNSGLGLSIVYKLLEIEDGTIEVNSTPGKGTEFTIILQRGRKPVLQ